MKILIAFVLVAAASTAAHADAPVRPKWMWSVGPLIRASGTDADASAQLGRLEEYGWVTHRPALAGLRGDLAYLQAPIIDAGFAWAWARGTYASGPGYDDPDTITGETLEAGVFARVHWVKPDAPVSAEPRVELGLARSTASMRGVDSQRLGYYTRIGLDFRLGPKRAGAIFSVDYTSIHQGESSTLDLPTGGVSFSLSFFWRQW
jgi:hypothetical protein